MKSFPMFIRTTGRRVVIAGGGEQAAQKTRLILKTDAIIVLFAPKLDDELAALAAEGRVTHHDDIADPRPFDGAAMAFIATGCPATDACLHGLAQAARSPVNVVDQPDLCDITTPSIVDRDPVVVAIGTDGTAPVLARQIKTQVEQMLPVNIGGLAALAGRLRGAVAGRVDKHRRRAFWAWVFSGAPRTTWVRGAKRAAAQSIKAAIAMGGAMPTAETGSIALVGAGPGARDLLTLRAVQRLQEADVIFYDRTVDADMLEFARRDATRILVSDHSSAHGWPRDRISDVIIAEARKNLRVVSLTSGNPAQCDRTNQAVQSALKVGIDCEIVPGVAMDDSLEPLHVSEMRALA